MADLELDLDDLARLKATVDRVRGNFSRADSVSHDVAALCGHHGLEKKVNDFADNWKINREALEENLHWASEALKSIIDTFTDLDARLAKEATAIGDKYTAAMTAADASAPGTSAPGAGEGSASTAPAPGGQRPVPPPPSSPEPSTTGHEQPPTPPREPAPDGGRIVPERDLPTPSDGDRPRVPRKPWPEGAYIDPDGTVRAPDGTVIDRFIGIDDPEVPGLEDRGIVHETDGQLPNESIPREPETSPGPEAPGSVHTEPVVEAGSGDSAGSVDSDWSDLGGGGGGGGSDWSDLGGGGLTDGAVTVGGDAASDTGVDGVQLRPDALGRDPFDRVDPAATSGDVSGGSGSVDEPESSLMASIAGAGVAAAGVGSAATGILRSRTSSDPGSTKEDDR